MKGCILLQGNFAKIGQSIALKLKERHAIDEWCAYVISPRAKKFVEKQTDLKYTNFIIDHEIQDGFEEEKLDLDYLQTMEKEYGSPNFWPYLYTDRMLMMSGKGMDQKTMKLKPLYDHENLLKIIQKKARIIEKFLDEEKPDFIVFFALGQVGNMLLYHIARAKGIKVLNIEPVRIGPKITMSEDYNTITGIKEKFQEIHEQKRISPYQTQAKKILDHFRKTKSLDLGYIKEIHRKKPSLKKRIEVYKKIVTVYLEERHFTHDKPASPWYFFKQRAIIKLRGLKSYSKIFKQPDYAIDYAFFPLQFEPETSLLNVAPFFSNQIAVIGYIARSLPIHYKLYVKEHPAMINRRKLSYYKELLNLPNVVLVDPKISSYDLIEHCKLVTVINSTVGWEATLLGKPVISFGSTFFNEMPSVIQCKQLDQLPYLIKKQLETYQYNEKEIIDFISALLEDGGTDFNYYALEYKNYEETKKDAGVASFADLIAKKLKSHE